jgi:hypothetical protein
MDTFEKLGVFYLGKQIDPETRRLQDDYLLYDSRDLVTHAVCVGMTGSGKTGLCITLLEEAAIDGIPALIVDPKGDLGNLLLSFPELQGSDFLPWVSDSEAATKGMSREQYAEREAERWRQGLAQWGQDGNRVQKLRSAAEFVIFTPGSTAGAPVSIAPSFFAPPPQYYSDRELLAHRVSSTASGLLGLLGIEADPLRSREHILISNILESAWMSGKDADLAALIGWIQLPPVQRIGVFDLESFYPTAERRELAMMLNNLLAAPGFSAWLAGEPLDIARVLYTPAGKPRVSVFSIAHLSDAERMFFVTTLLNQTLAWMRSQPGTTSLRAILYMDEIFGFFPPVAEPPSKKPLLTLLKQARAYGVGVALATQNPVDLDYKGLANTGTWFIGRLQTERDRDRLIQGLLSASAGSQELFDRDRIQGILSSLDQRQFLLQNIHEDRPVLFNTRWSLSYLAGPLTRDQIRSLTAERPQGEAATAAQAADPGTRALPAPAPAAVIPEAIIRPSPPQIPAEVPQFWAPVQLQGPAGSRMVYHPFLLAAAQTQIVNNKYGFASTLLLSHVLELKENMTTAPWDTARAISSGPEQFSRQGESTAQFLPVPTTALEPRRIQASQKGYLDFVYRKACVTLRKSSRFNIVSQPDEPEQAFMQRLQQVSRERRDFEVDRLRQRYASKLSTLQQRLMRAQQRTQRESEQLSEQKSQTAISLGATILGALMGRKAISASTLGRATTATRQASRIMRERQDVQRAEEEQEALQKRISELQAQLQQEADRLAETCDPQAEILQSIQVRAAKQDILLQRFGVLWVPHAHAGQEVTPLWAEV